jgi:hypothetical protein
MAFCEKVMVVGCCVSSDCIGNLRINLRVEHVRQGV